MEKLSKVNTYINELYCDNCGSKMQIEYDKLALNNYPYKYVCSNCGKVEYSSKDYPEVVYEIVKPSIKMSDLVKLQHKLIELFAEEDDDYEYVDWHAVKCIERRITVYLNRMTKDKELQHKIRSIIENENWNTSDGTYKPICNKLRELGFEIKEGV